MPTATVNTRSCDAKSDTTTDTVTACEKPATIDLQGAASVTCECNSIVADGCVYDVVGADYCEATGLIARGSCSADLQLAPGAISAAEMAACICEANPIVECLKEAFDCDGTGTGTDTFAVGYPVGDPAAPAPINAATVVTENGTATAANGDHVLVLADGTFYCLPGKATATPQADLVTVKTLTSGDATPKPGDTVEFQVCVTNNGPTAANNVTLTETLPTGLTLAAPGMVVDTGTIDGAGLWTIGGLAVAAKATLTVTATVDAASVGAIDCSVSAAVDDGTTLDPTTTGDDLNEPIPVEAVADLVTTKTLASGDPTPTEGDQVEYLITVTNNGPQPAVNVTLTDTIPAGLTLVSGTPTAGTFTPGTGLWTIGAMAVTDVQTISVIATVDAGTDGTTLTNNVTAATDTGTVDCTTVGDDLDEPVTVTNTPTPIAVDNTFNVNKNDTVILDILGNDSAAVGGLPIDIASVVLDGAEPGEITPNANGTLTWTPAPGSVEGTVMFTYTVDDTAGNTSNSATITITCTDTDVPPNSQADVLNIDKNDANVPLNVLANDTMGTNPIVGIQLKTALPANVVEAPANSGNFIVNPTAAAGTVTFDYCAEDDEGNLGNTVTVTINCTDVPKQDLTLTIPCMYSNDPTSFPTSAQIIAGAAPLTPAIGDCLTITSTENGCEIDTFIIDDGMGGFAIDGTMLTVTDLGTIDRSPMATTVNMAAQNIDATAIEAACPEGPDPIPTIECVGTDGYGQAPGIVPSHQTAAGDTEAGFPIRDTSGVTVDLTGKRDCWLVYRVNHLSISGIAEHAMQAGPPTHTFGPGVGGFTEFFAAGGGDGNLSDGPGNSRQVKMWRACVTDNDLNSITGRINFLIESLDGNQHGSLAAVDLHLMCNVDKTNPFVQQAEVDMDPADVTDPTGSDCGDAVGQQTLTLPAAPNNPVWIPGVQQHHCTIAADNPNGPNPADPNDRLFQGSNPAGPLATHSNFEFVPGNTYTEGDFVRIWDYSTPGAPVQNWFKLDPGVQHNPGDPSPDAVGSLWTAIGTNPGVDPDFSGTLDRTYKGYFEGLVIPTANELCAVGSGQDSLAGQCTPANYSYTSSDGTQAFPVTANSNNGNLGVGLANVSAFELNPAPPLQDGDGIVVTDVPLQIDVPKGKLQGDQVDLVRQIISAGGTPSVALGAGGTIVVEHLIDGCVVMTETFENTTNAFTTINGTQVAGVKTPPGTATENSTVNSNYSVRITCTDVPVDPNTAVNLHDRTFSLGYT